MKVLALSVAALALSYLAQPILANVYEQHQQDQLAAQCFSESSLANVTEILRPQILNHLEGAIRRDEPKSKITRSDLDKVLKLSTAMPSVEAVYRPIHGVDCKVQVKASLTSASADTFLAFTNRQSANGGAITFIRTAEIGQFLDALSLEINKLPAK